MTSSLQDSLTPRDVIDQIILSLNSDKGSSIVYILVEGVNDCRIYPRFFDNTKTSVEFIPGGKGQLVNALIELNHITRQIIGIGDADFNHLEKKSPAVYNLFFTDYHDIEITMLSVAGVLDDILLEYRPKQNSQEILKKALREAEKVSYVRWFNELYLTKLDFGGLSFGNLSTPHDISICLDINTYLEIINKRSKNKTKEVTLEEIAQFSQEHHTDDLYNLCNGHDVIGLMTLIIGHSTSPEKFSSILRVAFSMQCFCKTKLYADIVQFQIAHGFTILRS